MGGGGGGGGVRVVMIDQLFPPRPPITPARLTQSQFLFHLLLFK